MARIKRTEGSHRVKGHPPGETEQRTTLSRPIMSTAPAITTNSLRNLCILVQGPPKAADAACLRRDTRPPRLPELRDDARELLAIDEEAIVPVSRVEKHMLCIRQVSCKQLLFVRGVQEIGTD